MLIGLTHGLHELELVNFVPDSYYFIIPVSFLFTFTIWNALLIYDKKKQKNPSVKRGLISLNLGIRFLSLGYEKVFKAFPFYHSNHFVSYRSF